MSKKMGLITALLTVMIFASFTLAQMNEDARKTLMHVERTLYPENLTYLAKMTIQRPKRTLEKKVKVYLRGNKRALIEFLDPPQERGMRVLRVGEDMWMFLPSVEKVIRLSGKMSVTGGDFMYDDILRVKYTEDYNPVSLSDAEGYKLLHIEANHDKAPYKAINIFIEPTRFLPVKQEFYVASGLLLKRLTYTDLRPFVGKLIPSKLVMELADSADYKTTLDILEYETAYEISERVFTREYLKKGM